MSDGRNAGPGDRRQKRGLRKWLGEPLDGGQDDRRRRGRDRRGAGRALPAVLPNLRPEPTPEEGSATFEKPTLEQPVTFGQYLRRVEMPQTGTRSNSSSSGVIAAVQLTIKGYRGKSLPLRWYALDLGTHDIVDEQSKRYLFKPDRNVTPLTWPFWSRCRRLPARSRSCSRSIRRARSRASRVWCPSRRPKRTPSSASSQRSKARGRARGSGRSRSLVHAPASRVRARPVADADAGRDRACASAKTPPRTPPSSAAPYAAPSSARCARAGRRARRRRSSARAAARAPAGDAADRRRRRRARQELERVAQAVRDALEHRPGERAAVVAELEADERAARVGVGVGRALALQVRLEEQALRARAATRRLGERARRGGRRACRGATAASRPPRASRPSRATFPGTAWQKTCSRASGPAGTRAAPRRRRPRCRGRPRPGRGRRRRRRAPPRPGRRRRAIAVRLVRGRQPLARELERREHLVAPAPVRDVEEQRPGRVGASIACSPVSR